MNSSSGLSAWISNSIEPPDLVGDYGHIIYSTLSINLILQKGGKSNISFQSHGVAQCIYLCKALIIGGEGNGTPLQSSCLENPVDGGAW